MNLDDQAAVRRIMGEELLRHQQAVGLANRVALTEFGHELGELLAPLYEAGELQHKSLTALCEAVATFVRQLDSRFGRPSDDDSEWWRGGGKPPE
ncbi:MAG: hypothetical protein SH850_25815 [Planctomycetaceae bacterium]|nr:hypothetical protein [Planctomycetaceae bacterium]